MRGGEGAAEFKEGGMGRAGTVAVENVLNRSTKRKQERERERSFIDNHEREREREREREIY
jgi:hypothetical protein